MITASEALSHYKQNEVEAERFREEVLDAIIRKTMEKETHICLEGLEIFCVGRTINFEKYSFYHESDKEKLTNTIFDHLENIGYEIEIQTLRSSNDKRDGLINIYIKWQG